MFWLVAAWAFAEATLWFVVADVPIMATGALYGRQRAVQAAFLATLCAALGGVAMYLWALADAAGSLSAILALPGMSEALYAEQAARWHADGLAAMLTGSFSGVPYKIYAHAAGAAADPLAVFALDSLFARAPRFVVVALVSGWLLPRVRARLGGRVFWALFVAAWALFYAWYWSAMAA